ncbi:MAG: hypothetical protein HY650_10385 [Acidobacteria bacterium]|nr:hypothetical protein [Acidobacteriota bacterium]
MLTKLIIFGVIILALIALGKSARQRLDPSASRTEGPRANKEQLIVLWLGIGLISLIALFPPWTYTLTVTEDGRTTESQREAGYHPIFEPPRPQNAADPARAPTYADGVRLDYPRIAIQLAVVVLIVGGLFWTFRSRASRK